MNGGGTSDASTSTDDVKDRPLCLFYFTHPFGVLSPEPPTVSAAPAGVSRAFLNMEPMEPFYWAGVGAAPPTSSTDDAYRSSGPGSLQYELGAAVHASPLSVVGVARARRASSPLSSALFASDLWLPGGGPRADLARRPPYARMLPPLRLPSPRDLADATGSDDVWPARCLNRFSLPPIELPRPSALTGCEDPPGGGGAESAGSARSLVTGGSRGARCAGVRKARWRRSRDVRRVLARLMRRAVKEGACCRAERGASPALQRVLAIIRDAWAEPASLRQRCRVLSRMFARDSGSATNHAADSSRHPAATRGSNASIASAASVTSIASTTSTASAAMPVTTRPGASPGLLCRRYSVPETIMRKYRLEQQSTDLEEYGTVEGTPRVPRDTPRSAGESPRHLRRDRELMRKSALLRRMWARPLPSPSPSPAGPAPAQPICRCQMRSLDASRDELRSQSPASGSETSAPASPETLAERARDDSEAFPASPPSTAKATAASTEFASSLDRHSCSPLPPARSYEVLEVMVSESVGSSPPAPPRLPSPSSELSLDEYVSRVLVESLHSLTDRLEGAAVAAAGGAGGARRLSVVEKEIKVRLQNAAVNTIVHLSPTSNHQIIFGNEELCDEASAAPESRPAPPPAPLEPADRPSTTFDAVIQHDNVNRAVLQQIQKLFREEMQPEESELRLGAAVSLVELSEGRSEGSPVASVGAGNYLPPHATLVPRRSAVPHSASMEVNASSSEDAEALVSDATSLVDSLDDPDSPRSALRPRAPSSLSSAPPPSAAFFVRIRDDAAPNARVAECLPERIRQKLHRRQRKRELRMECARRGKVRALRDELERRRAELQERDLRRRERAAAALADSLLEDAVAALARDECRRALDERTAAPQRRAPRAPPRARLPARPAPERAPRRIYQKSEIREGDKCIEILEILEYSAASRSSPETTPTDDSGERARGRRSRIPVPVPDAGHMRLTGGDGRPPPPLTELLLRALATPSRPAPPPEPRSRSNSLRFKRVFDMIPEERGGPSPAEEAASPPPAPAPAPAPSSPPRRVSTRSAGTSPCAARRVRSQSTMTSPSSRSAATSPRRAPSRPPPPPPQPPREGSRERCDVGRTPEMPAGPAPAGSGSGESGRSSSSERSGGSLLCSLAPRWLAAHARHRRRPRRAPPPPAAPPPGGWSVTVAGSCRAALPHDVEMRLRFPHERREGPPAPASTARHQECSCAACAAPPTPALPPAQPPSRHDRLTLTMKKEESSLVTRDGVGGGRKVSAPDALPELDVYRASRTKLKSSVKTRRGYSLHCWLPDDEREPLRANNGLSVLGCAIIPELKPRVPTMSERDLTRVYTPRHYLRS